MLKIWYRFCKFKVNNYTIFHKNYLVLFLCVKFFI